MGVTTREEALARLEELCPAAGPPALSADEMASLIDRFARASAPALETAYVVGDRVVAVNGAAQARLFRCVTAGTSGAAAPTWSGAAGVLVADGTVEWVDAGPAFDDLWDITAAAREGWRIKAVRSAHWHEISDGNLRLSLQQAHAQAVRMVNAFAPLVVG